MRTALRFSFVFFAILWLAGGLAEAGDEALQKAKSTFDDMKMKQDDLLEDAFTKAIADATKAGKLGDVEALTRERKLFVDSGVSPRSAAMKTAVQRYARTMKTAFGKLKIVYEREIKAETKAVNLEKAKTLQQQLNVLQDKFGDAAKDRELIEVIAATWAYDGRFGGNDGTTEDVLEKVRQGMKKGRLEVGLHTFGALSGVAATKSLFVRLQVQDATINLRLGEGSTLEVGELTQTEAKADSFKVPGSRLELLSAVWVPKEGEELADGTADYLQRLKVGAVEVSAKSFPNFRSGKIKTLDVTLRVADQRISVRQSEGSMSSVILK